MPVSITSDTLRWVDSVMSSLNDTQRIGQLFMLAAWSNGDSFKNANLSAIIQQYNIGGLIFMQGTPYRQALLCNYYQSLSKVPLMIGMDAEWGLNMRLDSTPQFPRQLTLGAMSSDSLIEQMGYELGNECKRLGVHINFAPVVDIDNNPNNAVINDRSFGEKKNLVISKAIAYSNGMQRAGILACAKHFPGHGDTEVDSHKDLPLIPFNRKRLDTLELAPFRAMIKNGVAGMMVAHLSVPALESNTAIPASLSPKIVDQLLQSELGFKGLVFTDALNMKAVTKKYAPGMADVKALVAGNDVLLFSENVPAAIDEILKAIKKGTITQEEIDLHVKKILAYKYRVGLNHYSPIQLANLYSDINNPTAGYIIRRLYNEAVTVVAGGNNVPKNIAINGPVDVVSIAANTESTFASILKNSTISHEYFIDANAPDAEWDSLSSKLENSVIVELHSMSRYSSKGYGVSDQTKKHIAQLVNRQKQGLLVLFGTPQSLVYFEDCAQIMVAYEDNEFSQTSAANALLGLLKPTGRLPVSANATNFAAGNQVPLVVGLKKKMTPAMLNALAENMDTATLRKIDGLALEGIAAGAFPGCQIVALRNGKVVYDNQFGSPTYAQTRPVNANDLYDLASITKIAYTTLACMKLHDEGKLDLEKTIGQYLPEAKKTNKQKIKIKDLLLHQAGLVPYISFYKNCLMPDGSLNANFTSRSDKYHTIPVADNLYMDSRYIDTMWQLIYASPLKTPGKYVYSDLDLYFLHRICESLIKPLTLEQYVQQNFYIPLQLKRTTFNPLLHGFTKDEIMPTELDQTFRKQQICGCVHDQGAAMCGGVQGHAGLFSTAEDLAVIMQMLNDGGYYKGKQYLKPSTVNLFTSKQSNVSRRGLGFDKPDMDPSHVSPACKSASALTFGHSGFTGTITWADPKENLVFVFLCNRVFPDAENKKIINMNIRTNIQEILYEAMPAK